MSSRILPKLGASKRIFAIVWMAALVVQVAPLAHAQCPTATWLPGMGVPGTNGDVWAITHWDPDGAGPLTPVIVLGGDFSLAGGVTVNRIAIYDPATGAWSALGTGMNDTVFALTALPNGELIAGGRFTLAGGVAAKRIAKWNGVSWSALGAGISDNADAAVFALTTLPNGQLIAGGYFYRAGSVFVSNIARWNGTSWFAMGNGLGVGGSYPNAVNALLTLSNGDIIAGGEFGASGSSSMLRVARWNGSNWSAIGPGIGFPVFALAQFPNGDIAASGGEASSPTVPPPAYVMRWNGTSWTTLGSMDFDYAPALAFLPDGNLVVGSLRGIFSWNGTAWEDLGPVVQTYNSTTYVFALHALPNGGLLTGGRFSRVGEAGVSNVARRTATTWSALTPGTNFRVLTLSTGTNGELLVGGGFSTINGTSSNSIAIGDGSNWSPLGAGVSGGYGLVYATTTTFGGDVVIGGIFNTAGNVPAHNIARWDGVGWSAYGTGLNGTVNALASLPDGGVVAGGSFYGISFGGLVTWYGNFFGPLGGGVSGEVFALKSLPNGHLYVGGNFVSAGGFEGISVNRIARWDGTSWSALGSGLNSTVYCIAIMPDGDVIAGGAFTTAGGIAANRIARWNGMAWAPLGLGVNGDVRALGLLPDGSLVAGGSFTTAGGMPADRIARWNGSTWFNLGTGMDGPVAALATLPNGDILVGGTFLFADGNPSAYFARYQISGWPVFSQQPSSAQTCAFRNTTLSAAATGSGPVNYQWQLKGLAPPYAWTNLNDGPISSAGQQIGIAAGAQSSDLTIIAAIDHSDDTDAEFRCVVSNACGAATSDTAPLHVWPVGTGDADGNEQLDGRDVAEFVNILSAATSAGAGFCAVDMDYSGTVNSDDLPLFIDALLSAS